ncbi:hypothetical protein ACJIZ3_023662 [Penstemon smallii]|uniref:Transposase-associated domain-containing protein n=1 Tax=Penstemon smallii TaxID=265156 RepID=A0ABD3TR35_9LAMI
MVTKVIFIATNFSLQDKKGYKLDQTKRFTSDEYVNGVRTFMRFSYKNMPHKDKWLCPCGRCLNQSLYPPNLVKLHLLKHGIDVTYSEWTRHGETSDIHVENHNNHGHMDETFEEEQLLEDLNLGRCNFDNYDPENTDVCYDDFNDTPDLIPDDEMDKFQKEHEEELKQENSIGWETRQKKIKELRRIRSPEFTSL